jgi:hypothetical protein
MPRNENGRREGRPIPNAVVYHDTGESKTSPLLPQASWLLRLYAVSGPMAEALAPLVFLEVLR